MGRAVIGFVDDVVFVRYPEINQFQREHEESDDNVVHFYLNDWNI